MSDQPSTRLRVDWTIPAPLLIALAGQACGIVAWGAAISQRVTTLEASVAAAAGTPSVVARLDERSATQTTTLNRIESRLDNLEHPRR